MIGTSLSHYRIVEELGRGGMGIVYRAEDSKLERTVAIKVLPASALSNEDDRARFYREAKAAASLNHPHIAQIYQIDEGVPEGSPADDVRPFIAMEFIAGGTLEDRIREGPFQLDEAVRIATQVAEALKAAHDKNIVHRDIKSANIMLTGDGQAKVLDFGLAQTAASTKLTRMGSTLGTIAYMSPEQARGEAVDNRTDLYSLGTVLYEMIAGRMPFGGEYEQAVVYSILNAEPEPLTALRTGVPMELEAVVAKALRKDAGLRYQTATGMIADLAALKVSSDASARYSSPRIPVSEEAPKSSGRAPIALPVAVGIAALLAGLLLRPLIFKGSSEKAPLDISLSLPGLDALISSQPAKSADLLTLSPDGNKVAYVGIAPEEGLYVRDLTSGGPARHIADRARTPAFSPDSRFIAYASEDRMYRAGLQGDAPEVITDGVSDIVGLYWAQDGYLYYAADYATGLSRVPAEGGTAQSLTSPNPDLGEIGHVYPELLPDGETVVFTTYSTQGYELKMLDMPSGRIEVLGQGFTPHVIEPDVLVFVQGPRLLAARLDVKAASLGSPVVISEAIYDNISSFSTNIGVSQKGDVLFVDGASEWDIPLEIRRWDGTREIVAPEVPNINEFLLSPDGRYVVMAGQGAVADPDIWLYDLQTRDTRRLTTNPLYDASPKFSGDGSTIWFASEREGISDLYSLDPASGEVEVLYRDASPKYIASAAPDDTYLVFQSSRDFQVLDLTDEPRASMLVENQIEERKSDISPDSRWIAYESAETGQGEVYVIDYPTTKPRERITVGGGQYPTWSQDGRSLYYKKGTDLYRVAMNTSGGRAGDPERVMEGIYDQFELLPDGSGVLVRATPPRRSARYIQNAIGRIEDRLGER